MVLPSSIIHFQNLLSETDLAEIDALLPLVPFEDGKATATGAAHAVKSNWQSVRGTNNLHIQKAGQIIINALVANPLFHTGAMPKMILPLTISKYETGMHYGWHTDSPVMTNMATIRVDLSMTLFLSDPGAYEGGELVIHTPSGMMPFKPAKGDAIIYPTTRLHRVNPVTSGIRIAAVTWMQSMIRDTEKRETLFQLKTILDGMKIDPDSEQYLLMQQVYCNLTRMWAEI